MAATEVNARWQAQVQEFFVDLGEQPPDQDSTTWTKSSTWTTPWPPRPGRPRLPMWMRDT
jgi:hypothetical protein